jgi:hypothetical protein
VQNARDRERGYLMGILTGRDPAKEVRAFDLAGYLRRRWERLFDERLSELRDVSRRQLWFSLAANVGSGQSSPRRYCSSRGSQCAARCRSPARVSP